MKAEELVVLEMLQVGWVLILGDLPPRALFHKWGLEIPGEIAVDVSIIERLRESGLIQGVEYSYPYTRYLLTERGVKVIKEKRGLEPPAQQVPGKLTEIYHIIRLLFCCLFGFHRWGNSLPPDYEGWCMDCGKPKEKRK